jgi:hypothetical protein
VKRAAIVFLVLAQAAVLKAENPDRATLKGLKSFFVLIENLSNDAKRGGLGMEQLKTDVELRLRKARVRLADHDFGDYLYINVSAFQVSRPEGFVYCIHVGLNQSVHLDRDKSISCTAQTWDTGTVGTAPRSEFASEVRGTVGDLVDKFINDYLAANQ